MLPLTLSVLDVGWPGDVPAIAETLDSAGYSRYWLTEHRSAFQSAAPTLLLPIAAGLTNDIRVGTAGILLRYASPRRILEEFRLLSMFFPGRLDLGVVGARVQSKNAVELWGAEPSDDYAERIRKLALLLSNWESEDSDIGPFSHSNRPELWVCGTSESSARLAGSVGANFAFHEYLALERNENLDGHKIVRTYKDNFEEGKLGDQPIVSVALYGACDDLRAEEAWNSVFGKSSRVPKPSFVGDATTSVAKLRRIADEYGADELAIQLLGGDLQRRLAGYKAIGELAFRSS